MKACDVLTYVGHTKFEGCMALPTEDGSRDPPPPAVVAMCRAWVHAAVELFHKHTNPDLEVDADAAILDAAFNMCQYGRLSVIDFDAKACECKELDAATVEHAATILTMVRALFMCVLIIKDVIVTYDNAREIMRTLEISGGNDDENGTDLGDFHAIVLKHMDVAVKRFSAATHRACRACIAHIPDITYDDVERVAIQVEHVLGIERTHSPQHENDVPDADTPTPP